MNIQESINYLKIYNRWRRGEDCDEPNPTKVGISLDILIYFAEKMLSLEEQKTEANMELLREFSRYLSVECNCPDVEDEIIEEFLNQ